MGKTLLAKVHKPGAKTVKRTYRFTEEEAGIIDEGVRLCGKNENRLVAAAVAGYVIEYANCDSLAQQFLYNSYMQRISSNHMHRTGQALPRAKVPA